MAATAEAPTTTTTKRARKPRPKLRSLTVDGAAIAAAIKRVKPVCPQARGIDALTGIRLTDIGRGRLALDATDTDTSARTTIACTVDGPRGFVAVVRATELADTVKALGAGTWWLTVDLAGGKDLQIDVGRRTVRLPLLRLEDFPALDFTLGVPVMTVTGEEAATTLKPALAFASHDETRPVLTYVFLDQKARTVWATDSYRLGMFPSKAIVAKRKDTPVAVGRLALQLALTGGPKRIKVTVQGAGNVAIDAGDAIFVSRALSGQPPQYRQLVPDRFELAIDVKRDELIGALAFCGPSAKKNTPLRFTVQTGALTIAARTPDGPGATETIDVRTMGTLVDEFGLNPDYVLAAARAITGRRGDRLRLRAISPLRPLVLEGANGTALLMPIRLSA